MQDLNDFLELEIYPAIFSRLDNLLPEFDLQYRKRYWQSAKNNLLKTDGTEGSTGGSVYIYENRPGIMKSYKASSPSRNLVNYIAERQAKTWIEAVRELAEFANIAIPSNIFLETAEIREAAKKREKTRTVWQELERYFHYLLLNDDGAKAHRKYLTKERGFTEEDIEYTGFGFYPGKKRTLAFLADSSHTKDHIDEVLNAFTADDRFNLCIPVSDKIGRTSGFIFRNINPQHKGDRYRYTEGFEKSKQLFNYQASFSNKNTPLILVEGQIDSKLMESRGIGRTASINGSDLSDEQAADLFSQKEENIILAFDGDDAGKTATAKAVDKLLMHPKSEQLNILVAQLPAEFKDPNDLLLAQGTKALQKIIDEAIALPLYLNMYIVESIVGAKADFFTASDEEKYIETIAKYAALIKNQLTKGRFIDLFLKTQGEQSSISRQTIEEAAAKLRYNQQVEVETSALQKATLEANRILKTGNLLGAKEYLEKHLSNFVSAEIREKVKPYSFAEFIQETATEPDDLQTGINALDDIVRIPQSAITLIAARPSHGKTSLMLNMFYNMVELYPEKQFFFFTYEEPAKYLLLKILNRMVFEEYGHGSDLAFLRHYQAGKKDFKKEIEEAKGKLQKLITGKRLNIFSFNLNDTELAEAIKSQYRKGQTGAVFIDYIQKIPVSQQAKGYEVIKQISSTILNKIAVPLQLPVVLGAQFNREARASRIGDLHADMLREGGDLEQDANTVLGLLNYNFTEDDRDEEGNEFLKGKVSQLDIKSLKYRNGTPGQIAHLKLYGQHNYVTSMEERKDYLNYLKVE